jgi:ankyrin repeat protein
MAKKYYSLFSVLLMAFALIGCESTIHTASIRGNVDKIKTHLNEGNNVNQKDANNNSPLTYAATYGRTESVKFLLEKGADIEGRSNEGLTPLMSAAINNRLETVKLLLEKGANIETRATEKKLTVLHMVATNDDPKMLKLLLKNGANVHSRGFSYIGEITALSLATVSNHIDNVKILIKYGSNKNDISKITLMGLKVTNSTQHREVYNLVLKLFESE